MKKAITRSLKPKIQVARLPLVIAILAVVGVGGAFIVNRTNAATCRSYTYKQGSSGTCVRYIQTIVGYIQYGNTTTLKSDGSFGPATKSAVVKFQQSARLSADGVVGPNTWNEICASRGALPPSNVVSAMRAAGCKI